MNIVLSSKAAKKLKKNVETDEGFIPDIDTWRIDCVPLVKRSVFMITNVKTLYTLVSSYKSGFGGIINRITSFTQQKDVDAKDIRYVKFKNGSLVSSMNNMKQFVSHLDKYTPLDNERIEDMINQTPFKYLSNNSPNDVHQAATNSD